MTEKAESKPTRTELEKQVTALEERAALVEKERDEHLDDLRRVAAEFENFRKRVARDQASLAARAHERLGKERLVEIETNGNFDPHVHEALLSQPSEQDDGAILEVLQKGYRLGDRVLRPARVVVAQGE